MVPLGDLFTTRIQAFAVIHTGLATRGGVAAHAVGVGHFPWLSTLLKRNQPFLCITKTEVYTRCRCS